MTLRANPFRAFPILLAFLLNVLIGPLAPLTQLGNQPATLVNLVACGTDLQSECCRVANAGETTSEMFLSRQSFVAAREQRES